jgi:hypothetical protein
VAACIIEEGRISLDRGRAPSKALLDRLISWIEPLARRELVERDPWVPMMLREFSADAGDTALAALTSEIWRGWEQRRSARDAEWSVVDQTFAISVPSVTGRLDHDAMAGEPRRLIVETFPKL